MQVTFALYDARVRRITGRYRLKADAQAAARRINAYAKRPVIEIMVLNAGS